MNGKRRRAQALRLWYIRVSFRNHRQSFPDRRFYGSEGVGERDTPSVAHDQDIALSGGFQGQSASLLAQDLGRDHPSTDASVHKEGAAGAQAAVGSIAAPIPYGEQA